MKGKKKALGHEEENTIQVIRPGILKPVIPPKRRDGSQYSGLDQIEGGYASTGQQIFNSGYISQGASQSDGDSIRLSNFK